MCAEDYQDQVKSLGTDSSCMPKIPKPPTVPEGDYFLIDKSQSETEPTVYFPDVPVFEPGHIPLRSIVRNLTSMKQMSNINIKFLNFILGRLVWLENLIIEYNKGIELGRNVDSVYYNRYIRFQMMEAVSVFGYQVPNDITKIQVPGLNLLIAAIQDFYKPQIDFYKTMIKEGAIIFDGLQELYKPGMIVRGMTSLGVPAGFKVSIVNPGDDFAVIQFEAVISRWMGDANRKLSDMFYAPVDGELLQKFENSGKKYVLLGTGGSKYLHHDPGCVFLHAAGVKSHSKLSGASTVLNVSGRILIDTVKGSSLGHHASHGMDDATHALIEITGRYKRFQNEQKSLGQKVQNPDGIFIISSVPMELLPITWPALVGFSFSSKSWCHVLVGGLNEIKYNDTAFDELVLDPKRKKLIKALVKFGGEQFEDIIQGKSGGSIFLLHGPAGVGKTLTAEAIAEVLHRPLYYVTMGELGTDPETMETRLQEILDLCSGWNALTLIDEADVFLEKRASSDILRNTMVCVMLRLLEYHQGILFLTTNRVTEFDPAFESRVTVALRYDQLTVSARIQVWKNLIDRLTIPKKVESINWDKLGEYVLNGRQIKNAVRLAVALALDGKQPLDHGLLEETLAIANAGREDMLKAEKCDPTMVSRKPVTLDIEDSPKLKFHYYQPKVEMPKPLVKYPKLFPNTFINTNRSPTIGMKSPSSYSSTSERTPVEMTSLQHSEIAGGMMCHGVPIRIPTVSPDVLEATRVDLADVQNTTEYQDSIHNTFNLHCI
ncbi:hypothetical protein HDV04_003445 [Boothiomyces sp. JEL0838]|nr:hypothetical protein HDV04_003445 [Boothiomyces sp. JEL0838]